MPNEISVLSNNSFVSELSGCLAQSKVDVMSSDMEPV